MASENNKNTRSGGGKRSKTTYETETPQSGGTVNENIGNFENVYAVLVSETVVSTQNDNKMEVGKVCIF